MWPCVAVLIRAARLRGNQDKRVTEDHLALAAAPRGRLSGVQRALIDVDFALALRFQPLRSAPFTFGALHLALKPGPFLHLYVLVYLCSVVFFRVCFM